jgi:uncharacterized protein
MAVFALRCFDPSDKTNKVVYYDNSNNLITDGHDTAPHTDQPVLTPHRVSRETPAGKAALPRVLKIQMGLSCNYSCEYCVQRFVPHADETSAVMVPAFVEALRSWFNPPNGGEGRRIEFWGGEPLVYLKTMRPLAEKLRAAYPNIRFSTITNGSLLTREIVDWFYDMGFSLAISHDGPGQAVRGIDPLTRPATRDAWLYAYQRLSPYRISFNTMMNRENRSRWAAAQFFRELTGNPGVVVGEGSIVDAYDEGGVSMSLRPEDFKVYANQAWAEIRQTDVAANFGIIPSRVNEWLNAFNTMQRAETLGQKCGMDRMDSVAVDLRGNVVTCQNVSASATAPNGESHKIGHMSSMEDVKLNTATHWSFRDKCSKCPVLQVCKGSCMFLEGELFEVSCNNAYFDHVPMFAEALLQRTGLVLREIVGDLPAERRDPFGLAYPAPLLTSSTSPELQKWRLHSDFIEAYYVPDVLNKEECKRIIGAADTCMAQDFTVGKGGFRVWSEHRTSASSKMPLVDSDFCMEREIDARLAAIIGWDPAASEPMRLLRYEPGQQFKLHADYFPDVKNEWTEPGGQRVWTALLYLNDMEQDQQGETNFPDAGIQVSPRAGSVLLFRNLLDDGQCNYFARHEGRPPAFGVKFCLTKFFRQEPGRNPLYASVNQEVFA